MLDRSEVVVRTSSRDEKRSIERMLSSIEWCAEDKSSIERVCLSIERFLCAGLLKPVGFISHADFCYLNSECREH